MQIKKFNAETISEALRLVKAEFGIDAVILSTKSIRGKGVEVTAAADRETEMGRRGDGEKGRWGEGEIKPIHPFTDSPIHQLLEAPDLHSELKELKSLMGSLVNHVQKDEFFSNSKKLSKLQSILVSSGIDENLSYKMLQCLSKGLNSQELEDMPGLMKHLKQFIAKQVAVGEIVENGHGPKIAMFVGPTGVGKTTTIAKLAAINTIQRKKRVALVTLDTYRIAAVEQLKIYARIIGIPVNVADSPSDFVKVVAGIKGVDLILVDTAGRSQRDKKHMEELRHILNSGIPVETHLVLSATAKEKDAIDIIRHYKDMKVDSLLFTKLDETTTYGGILNALIASGKPVSYLTTGQSVPEDIEAARPEKIAELILGNTVNSEQ